MKNVFLTAASTAVFGLLLAGCAPATDNTPASTPTVKSALTWTSSDFYLVGTINPTATAWDNGTTPVNLMTKLSGSVYERTVALTVGTWSFQMADSTWTDKFTGTADITTGVTGGALKAAAMVNANVTVATAGNYTFHFDLANQTVAVVPAMYLYDTLASDGTAVWTASASNVALYSGKGVYQKTVSVTTAGTFGYLLADSAFTTGMKYSGSNNTLTTNGASLASTAPGMANATATIAAAGNYTIRFDTVNNTVALAPAYYLVGKILAWDAGDYNAGSLANLFVYDGSNSYSKIIKVTKGTATTAPDFQFTTSDWGTKWTSTAALTLGTAGVLEAAGMANKTVGITATGSYLVTFNPVALTVKFSALP